MSGRGPRFAAFAPLIASGNVTSGAVHSINAARNVVHAEGNEVVLYGVSDLVVVTHEGLTLVTTTEHADGPQATARGASRNA